MLKFEKQKIIYKTLLIPKSYLLPIESSFVIHYMYQKNGFLLINYQKKTYMYFLLYNFFVLFSHALISNRYLTSWSQCSVIQKHVFYYFNQYHTQYFLTLFGEHRLRLHLVGSGFFFTALSPTCVQITLNFSHVLIFTVPESLILEVRGRKKRILVLKGYDLLSLKQYAKNLKHSYPKDIYKGKGIRFLKEKIKLKKGKKKFV